MEEHVDRVVVIGRTFIITVVVTEVIRTVLEKCKAFSKVKKVMLMDHSAKPPLHFPNRQNAQECRACYTDE